MCWFIYFHWSDSYFLPFVRMQGLVLFCCLMTVISSKGRSLCLTHFSLFMIHPPSLPYTHRHTPLLMAGCVFVVFSLFDKEWLTKNIRGVLMCLCACVPVNPSWYDLWTNGIVSWWLLLCYFDHGVGLLNLCTRLTVGQAFWKMIGSWQLCWSACEY